MTLELIGTGLILFLSKLICMLQLFCNTNLIICNLNVRLIQCTFKLNEQIQISNEL